MSLETALAEEANLVNKRIEQERRKSASNLRPAHSRGRSLSPNDASQLRTGTSRGRSQGRSLTRSITGSSQDRDGDTRYKWSIINHDPSERLRSPSSKSKDSDDDADESSEEEQISDTDTEFEYDDGGTTLANFATYSRPSDKKSNSEEDTMREITNNRMLKEAQRAEYLDQISAAERAAVNARSIGQDISEELQSHLNLNSDGKFYQNERERKEKLKEYATYKRSLISPSPNSGQEGQFAIPYTSDIEERMDSQLATFLNSKIDVSDMDSNVENARVIRTITRGNFFSLSAESRSPKAFLLCMDFSDESKYALEWCMGTILVDGSVLYIVNVIEDDSFSSQELNGIPSKSANNDKNYRTNTASRSREATRKDNVETITHDVLHLLKQTKLQVHIVLESLHHPIPRTFITDVIDHLSPTLVIVGSKGKSQMKGILLGSLSNYLVRRSSVPVMVVRKKLKKLYRKKTLSKTVGSLHSLSEARAD